MSNFALNDRIWNPAATIDNENMPIPATFLPDLTSTGLPNYQVAPFRPWIPNVSDPIVVQNNNQGMGFFHENRCKGKAVFAIDTETLNRDSNVLAGIDTKVNQPFYVRMAYNTNSANNRFAYTADMYTFYYYDKLIRIKNGDIQIIDRVKL